MKICALEMQMNTVVTMVIQVQECWRQAWPFPSVSAPQSGHPPPPPLPIERKQGT